MLQQEKWSFLMRKVLLPSLLSMLFILGSCGDESSTEAKDSEKQDSNVEINENSSTKIDVYDSEDDLPNCTAKKENTIVEVRDVASFVCKNKA